jgi:hypothetical protein
MEVKKRFLLPITFYYNFYNYRRVWQQPSLFPYRSSVVAGILFKNKLNLLTNYVCENCHKSVTNRTPMIDASTHTRKIWRSHFDGADSTISRKFCLRNKYIGT